LRAAELHERAELRRLVQSEPRRDAARLRAARAYYGPDDYAYGYAPSRRIARSGPVYRYPNVPNVRYLPAGYASAQPYYPYPEENGSGGLLGGGFGGILGALLPVILQQVAGGSGGGLGNLGGLLGGSGGPGGDSYGFANPGDASFAGLDPSYADPYARGDVGYGYDDGYGYADAGYGSGTDLAGGGSLGDTIGSIFGSGLLGGSMGGLGGGLLGVDPLGGFDLDGQALGIGGADPLQGNGYADAGGLDAAGLVTQLIG
jgi:hypothetical protein